MGLIPKLILFRGRKGRRASCLSRDGDERPFAKSCRDACLNGGWKPETICRIGLLLLLALGAAGCASSARDASFARPFVFGHDNFSYANDLMWVYYKDPATGKMRHKDREPSPDYTHHCFPVARSARQFFQHARFDPTLPVVDERTYRRLIRQVVKTSPRKLLKPEEQIVIPGFPDLFAFSQAHEKLLKQECGGAWQSYFQRGHWRMIMPFSRNHQSRTAARFQESIRRNRPLVVHVVRFPSLVINHAIVIFDVREKDGVLEFAVYDPYDPLKPATLTFVPKERRFYFPANDYFVGGRVDAYEVFCSWNY